MSWVEIVGFTTGALCVWLTVRQNIWNFPVGNVQCAFYIVVFLQAGLYADAGLQVVYIVLGFLGWWWWLHGGLERGPLQVRALSAGEAGLVLLIGIAGTALLTWLLAVLTPSTVPFWDGLTTCLSLVAQY